MNRSRLLVFAVVLASARAAAAAAVPDARQLYTYGQLPAVRIGSNAAPTRIVLARALISDGIYAYEQQGVLGTWKDTTAVGADPSMVVVRSGLQSVVHAFYAKPGSGGKYSVGHVTRSPGGVWSQDIVPSMPLSVTLYFGPVAVSNLYNAVSGIEAPSLTPQMEVYFIGSNYHLYAASWQSSWQGGWRDLGVPPGYRCNGQLVVTASFDNGVFSTSVWVPAFDPPSAGSALFENRGRFYNSRSWSRPSLTPALASLNELAASTWYDPGGVYDPSTEHTRVFYKGSGGLYAYYRERFSSGTDRLDLSPDKFVSGLALQDCGGCAVPPVKPRVLASKDGKLFSLDKGNQDDQSSAFVDIWSPLPDFPAGGNEPLFNRIPLGSGMGPVYAINSVGHLYELMPQTGRWIDHVAPGGENLIAATSQDGNLQVFGLSPFGGPRSAFLRNWQDRSSGAWHPRVGFNSTNSYTALASGMSRDDLLYVFGIDASTQLATIVGTQHPRAMELVWTTASTPSGQTVTLNALTVGKNAQGLLQVIGIGASNGRAYHVVKQPNSTSWSSTNTLLPGQTQNLTSITAVSGNSDNLQVLGLGADGRAYLAGWMDSNSGWHAGFILPGQTVDLGAIAAVRNPAGALQVVGLSTAGTAYLVAWQDTNGNWSPGFELPGQIAPMTSITAQMGAGNPQIVGVGANDGVPYLISWQAPDGNWNPGFKLEGPGISLSNLIVAPGTNGQLQVIGLGPDNLIYQSASQDAGGVWHPGSSSPLP